MTAASWPDAALERLAAGSPLALVTVLATEGSAPRDAGARMLVWPSGQWGTIGGGNLEHQVTLQARRMLGTVPPPAFAVQDFPLGPFLAQCCGGRVRLMIERLTCEDSEWLAEAGRRIHSGETFTIRSELGRPGRTLARDRGPAIAARGARPETGDLVCVQAAEATTPLLLFGAGHVGRALAAALAPLPFRLRWFDDRAEVAESAGAAHASRQDLCDLAATGGPLTLILTHDHALDYALTLAALGAPGGGWVGLIGSATKRARFTRRLLGDGIEAAALSRLSCPIGLPAIAGKAPEIIALSVAADLLIRQQASTPAVCPEPALASL